MAWSKKREPDLETDLDLLLGDLCTEWGFCNWLLARELIGDGQELSAEDFARRVLEAEGMNPEYEPGWRRRIRNAFRNRYGPSISSRIYEQPID